jgi:PEP-CTERM motif
MRLPLLIPALLTALALPSAALADDFFTYIPDNGPAITFTLSSSQIFNVSPYNAVQYNGVVFSNGSTGAVTLNTPAFSTIYSGTPQDISLGSTESSPGAGNSFGANFDGAQIFLGDIGNNVHFVPTFAPGIFHLTGFPAGVHPATAILCVDIACNATSAPTPEPSALYLFGSGALGLLGVARRFRKA